MAPALSKLTPLKFSCHELGHTWATSCPKASADLGVVCFKESFKIYTTCYIFSLLASRRWPKSYNDAIKVLKDILRSSTFLTSNAVGYISVFCFLQRVLGAHNFYTSGLLPAFIASYGAILVEKPGRRSLLALYVTNVASETVFRMLRSRGIVRNVKNFDLLLFLISISTLLYQMKKQSGRNDIVDTILKKIIGEEEFLEKRSEFMPDISRPRRSMDENISIADQIEAERNEAIIAQREVNNVGPGLGPIFGPEVPVELPSESNEQASGEEYAQNREQMLQRRALASRQNDETYRRRFIKFVLWMHRQVEDIAFHLQRMVTAIDEGRIHDTCPHRKPCFEYWFNGFWSRFATGVGIQLAIETVLFIKQLIVSASVTKSKIQTSLVLKRNPFHNSIKNGLGLGAFCLTFRLLSCSFRWLLGNEDCSHAIPSSIMATALGFVLIRPPPSLGLYLFFKGLQSAIADSHRQNNWKLIKAIDSIFGGGWCLLYAISTAILFHAGIYEPHNLKPSYYKFLVQLTCGKFLAINRHLLSAYGTNSNLLTNQLWPEFDQRFVSSTMRKLIEERDRFLKDGVSLLESANNNELMKELVTKVLVSK